MFEIKFRGLMLSGLRTFDNIVNKLIGCGRGKIG